MDVVQATVRFVDAELGLVARIAVVGIGGEKFRKDNFAGVGATDGKSIAYDRPLRLAVEAEDFAEVVQEAGEDEPTGMAVFANGLGGLQQMFDLGEVGVRVAFIHKSIQVM